MWADGRSLVNIYKRSTQPIKDFKEESDIVCEYDFADNSDCAEWLIGPAAVDDSMEIILLFYKYWGVEVAAMSGIWTICWTDNDYTINIEIKRIYWEKSFF